MTTKNPWKSKYLDLEFSWTETLFKIIHWCFRYDQVLALKLQSSLVPHRSRGKSAFFSYGYNRNTWFEGKTIINFREELPCSLYNVTEPWQSSNIFLKERLTKCHYDLKFCNKRNFQQITYANYHHETSYSF